eukprot:gnl/MRDRNA2_/MRDRNA2_82793_c0_seq2.p1 gnl/MRDRNA2_/MRDRNA2_82793_c0~~gnl/MRDRNA2_/MRDRNA2_82793_c0_seq2.p1  ORF type:complete len:204 (+),score=34.25 gnl/MRDRNA2_/MRDRNA2_82793_c0_seq2:22-612(+)
MPAQFALLAPTIALTIPNAYNQPMVLSPRRNRKPKVWNASLVLESGSNFAHHELQEKVEVAADKMKMDGTTDWVVVVLAGIVVVLLIVIGVVCQAGSNQSYQRFQPETKASTGGTGGCSPSSSEIQSDSKGTEASSIQESGGEFSISYHSLWGRDILSNTTAKEKRKESIQGEGQQPKAALATLGDALNSARRGHS